MRTLASLFLATFSLSTFCNSACPPDFQYEQNGDDRDFFCSLLESDNRVKKGLVSCNDAGKEFQEVFNQFRKGTKIKFVHPTELGETDTGAYQGLDIPESVIVKDRTLKCRANENQLDCAIYLYPNFNGLDSLEAQVNPLTGLSQCIVEAQPKYMRPSVSVYDTDRSKAIKKANGSTEPVRMPSGLSISK